MMEIKIGMKVHNVFKREWLTVYDIIGNIIYLRGPYTITLKLDKIEFEKMVNASPLNK